MIKEFIISTFKLIVQDEIKAIALYNTINSFFQFKIFEISIANVFLIILITAITLQLVKVIKVQVLKRLDIFAKKKNILILKLLTEQIEKIGNPFYITATLYFVGKMFSMIDITNNIFYPAFVIVCGFYSISLIQTALTWIIKTTLEDPAGDPETKKDESFIQLIKIMVTIITYVFVFLIVGQILNWNLSFIIGGLGISSLAVAFAIQNVLTDVFAAFTIFIDQPFRVNDQIILDGYTGTVKNIGLKSTRISLLDGDELIVSNQDLTSSRVRNLRKITSRRVNDTVLLSAGCNYEQIMAAKDIIKLVIDEVDHAEFERVAFTKIDTRGKEVEYVYHIPNQSYDMYREVEDAINCDIVKRFDQSGIELSVKI